MQIIFAFAAFFSRAATWPGVIETFEILHFSGFESFFTIDFKTLYKNALNFLLVHCEPFIAE